MPHEFSDYVSLRDAIDLLRANVSTSPRREIVSIGESYGRVLFEDVVSKADVPVGDTSHMDGFAVRSLDLASAAEDSPVSLRVVPGPPLGRAPSLRARNHEAHTVLTGGLIPAGADAVIPSERVKAGSEKGTILVTEKVRRGEYIFSRGRDMRKGELVLERGRVLRGPDQVLLATLHMDRVGVARKPRVAVIPTGNELTPNIRNTEPGRVVETHSLLLSRLIEGAGGMPMVYPIARDRLAQIEGTLRRALKAADLVLTLAGSSVGEADLTGNAISNLGRPGVLVHGMKIFRGRVMGFGAINGKGVIILPGPIQGAVNGFALMGYPLIRSFLGRGFEAPPSVPAIATAEWEAAILYPNFTKIVYARISAEGEEVQVEPSRGESEKMTHLTRNDGYIILPEDTLTLKRGERVRVHLLPGLSDFPLRSSASGGPAS